MCPTCIAKQSEGALRRYYEKKEARVCRDCGVDISNLLAESTRCLSCAEGYRTNKDEWTKRKMEAGKCRLCSEPAREGLQTCQKCADRIGDRQSLARLVLKTEVFEAYGGLKCVNCGFDKNIDCLQMDHVDGGGRKHLEEIGQSQLYIWLKRNNFPAGFRVLCANCNFSLGKVKRTRSTAEEPKPT